MAPVSSPNRVRARGRLLRRTGVLCALGASLLCLRAEPPVLSVSAVRFWSLDDVTRVAIEISGEFTFATDRIPDPDRVFFDIRNSQSGLQQRGTRLVPVGDKLLRQIRVAQNEPAVTRIVLDLEPGVEVSTSQLTNPSRLMVELRRKSPETHAGALAATPGVAGLTRLPPPAPEAARVETPKAEPWPAPARTRRQFQPPEKAPAPPAPIASLPPRVPPSGRLPKESEVPGVVRARVPRGGQGVAPPPPEANVTAPASAEEAKRPPDRDGAVAAAPRAPADHKPLVDGTGPALPAKRDGNGDRSMTRALGLKIGRIVIDPGHGGHDAGTMGPNGLEEKALVLDVAMRLGALLEERMSSEVVYTRRDDTFVPLETRTAMANEHRADLFISIHANSSPYRSASGVETYYLNFTTNRQDLEVAARENASSQKSVYELKDLLQKIALTDKVGESREFASKVQSSLFSLASRGNPKLRNRGVKRAPFVVLIGASMPSILTEIGFVSNPKDETLMNRGDYRQKMAEALHKGVSQYSSSLSHFEVAQRGSAGK